MMSGCSPSQLGIGGNVIMTSASRNALCATERHRQLLGDGHVLVFRAEACVALREIDLGSGVSAYRTNEILRALRPHILQVVESRCEQGCMLGLRAPRIVEGLNGTGVARASRLRVKPWVHHVAFICLPGDGASQVFPRGFNSGSF